MIDMNFPVIEFFDRLAIAEVKWERTSGNLDELNWYKLQLSNYNMVLVSNLYNELKEIHSTIWDLEKELKSGKEAELELAEIGRRAILIRDWNNKRITIKNQMAELLSCPVREIKRDHLSEQN